MDGSQIYFGRDRLGFYTSRDENKRIYDASEYGNSFAETYRKYAHIVLTSYEKEFSDAGFTPGCQIEVEVIYGETPNVVSYSKDRNYLVLLRTTQGNVNIVDLHQKVVDKTLSVTLPVPKSKDGFDIEIEVETTDWEIKIPEVGTIDIRCDDLLSSIDDYINELGRSARFFQNSYTVKEFIETKLNDVPGGKIIKNEFKIVRESYRGWNKGSLEHITELLYRDVLVPNMKNLGTKNIEGFVLTSPAGEMFKVIDPNFNTIRKFYWKDRVDIRKMETFRELDDSCDKYVMYWKRRVTQDESGNIHHLTTDVYRRTLEAYAWRRQDLHDKKEFKDEN